MRRRIAVGPTVMNEVKHDLKLHLLRLLNPCQPEDLAKQNQVLTMKMPKLSLDIRGISPNFQVNIFICRMQTKDSRQWRFC